MNKKGFTLIEVLVSLVIMALIMMIILPSVTRVSRENKLKIYEEYEKMMVEYAKISDKKNNNAIRLTDLEELDKVKNDCSGYVTITHSTPPVYKAYIKCGEYFTKYSESDKYSESFFESID